MKKDWYHRVLKLARLNDMTLEFAVSVLRSSAAMKMNHRTAGKPGKTVLGAPRPFFGDRYSVPVISKRTGKVLYSKMEKHQPVEA